MKHRFLCAALLCYFGVTLRVVDAAERPNVVFFLSDDQRADFLSCAGHPIVKTPNIDRVASQGTRFRNAFVTTSICAASRATLFTGLWERSHKYTFGTPPIADDFITDSYPAQLKKANYRTGFVGKFGVSVPANATRQMFDSFVSLNRSPYLKKQADGTVRHLTDLTGDKAIEFLQSCDADQAFCLSVSFNASHAEDGDKENHYPWPASEDGLYEDVTIPPPLVEMDFHKGLPEFLRTSMNRDRFYWRWDTPEKYQKNVKAYYRMITGLDRNIGRVLEELDRLGRSENTIIVFMGDNGYYKASRGFAGKWSHYEESLRVPLVIADPRLGEETQGRVADEMALNVDVPATILDYALGKTPERYQGRSLKPIVQGQSPSDWRTDFFCEHLMDHAKIPKWEGVRGERYVYARYFQNLPEGEFLHDLKTDPQQRKNLVDDPAAKEILNQYRERCDHLRDERGGEYSQAKFPTQRYLRSQKRSQ